MAKISERVLTFTPSVDSDIAHYRVRILAEGTVFDYDFGFDSVGKGTGTTIEVDISDLPKAPEDEGTYDIYVTAVDQVGNESDPMVISAIIMDFTAPAAPTLGRIA